MARNFAEEFEDAAGFGWTVRRRAIRLADADRDNENNEIDRLNGVYKRLLSDAGVELHRWAAAG